MTCRVLAYEYLSTGALAGEAGSASLAAEGLAMLRAVLLDLAACPGVTPVTLAADDPGGQLPACELHRCDPAAEEALLRRLAAGADACLVIAPEFDDLLARRCEVVRQAGCRLLNATPAAIRLTADKLTLAGHLAAAGVPTPATWLLDRLPAELPYPLVVKPRFGAGSQAIFTVASAADLADVRRRAAAEGWTGELVAQPRVAGVLRHHSITWLIGPAGRIALPPAEQFLSDDGRFRYRGGAVPLVGAVADTLQAVSERAVRAVPGLHGLVGVDLVTTMTPLSATVIEINPRLTTSYIGLRRLARSNLLQLLLRLLDGDMPPPPLWRDGISVRFTPEGVCHDEPAPGPPDCL